MSSSVDVDRVRPARVFHVVLVVLLEVPPFLTVLLGDEQTVLLLGEPGDADERHDVPMNLLAHVQVVADV